ncbi:MAG: GrpB family protein [Planctomycetes bacterium]|nr:GrpB family protein [Planctomycetota bacterium]
MFEKESSLISKIFADLLIGIYHIGSTSVPGLAAKPVIDMLLVVNNIRKADYRNVKMQVLGYEAKGEFGIPGRRFFTKGEDDARTHHLHAFEPGNPAVAKHLDFRDYLIEHPADAAAYGKLKKALSTKYRNDCEAYMAGKDPLIKEILARAEKWRIESGAAKKP